jgi:hypothetical protein
MGCNQMLRLKDWVAMDQCWSAFFIAYQIKISYFMTFKLLKSDVYMIIMFDYSMIKVVTNCIQHDPTLERWTPTLPSLIW